VACMVSLLKKCKRIMRAGCKFSSYAALFRTAATSTIKRRAESFPLSILRSAI
jgi:hypothetical protein